MSSSEMESQGPSDRVAGRPQVPAPDAQGGSPLAVELRGISKDFGSNRALNNVSLTIADGEVVGLVGQNGSGKSTLVKVLAGVYAPEPGGRLFVSGAEVPLPLLPGQASEIGLSFVYQNLALAGGLSVLENLNIGQRIHGGLQALAPIHWRREHRSAAAVLDRYQVELSLDRRTAELPPVDQARLAIVRAAEDLRRYRTRSGYKHSVLVLDEPTVFLPEEDVERLFDLIRAVVAEGAAVLFISHDLLAVRSITDRVVVLRDGSVVGNVPAAEIDEHELVNLIVGVTARLTERAHARGAQVDGAQVDGTQVDGTQVDGTQVDSPEANRQDAHGQDAHGVQGDPVQGDPAQGDPVQGDPVQGDPVQGDPLQVAGVRTADQQAADLQAANLQAANLQAANLQAANLQTANLQAANLQAANFQTANLQAAAAPGTSGSDALPEQLQGVVVQHLTGGRVADLSFAIAAGEIVGVAGLIGSGAEDVPYALFGAGHGASGTLHLWSQSLDVTRLTPQRSVRERIALVPADRQLMGLSERLTLWENIVMLVEDDYYRGGIFHRAELVALAREAIERFEIRPPWPQAVAGTLSGGNQQKALLAKWLLARPRLLLLHEPTQGVDVGARRDIYRFVEIAAALDQTAVLWVTTDFGELAEVCNRVIVVSQGREVTTLSGSELDNDAISAAALGQIREV